MKIEIFGEIICPDTHAAWFSIVEPLLHKRAENVSIVFHLFPLSWHKNAFDVAQALTVMSEMRDPSQLSLADLLGVFFRKRDQLLNDAAMNITQLQLFTDVLAPIATSLGLDDAKFLSRMNMRDPSYQRMRTTWKYGAARGVSGLPTWVANGVAAPEIQSWHLGEWDAWIQGEEVSLHHHHQGPSHHVPEPSSAPN
jgi:hypothetical protein